MLLLNCRQVIKLILCMLAKCECVNVNFSSLRVKTPRTEFCVKPDEAWIKNAIEKQLC